VHYKNVKRNDIDTTYKWQLYFNLQKTEREWIDYVSFCADYPVGKRLFVHRVFAKDCGEVFAGMNKRLEEFEKLVAETTKNIIGDK
jgi:hypothetical protein